MIRFLRWLFGRRIWMPPDDRFEHENDAWKELQRRGYAVREHGGQYCITDCGVKASPWFVSDSLEARDRNIRAWANDELARVQALETKDE